MTDKLEIKITELNSAVQSIQSALADEPMTTEELAAFLGISLKAAYHRIRKGYAMPPKCKLPHFKGDRYLRSEVIAWMKSYSSAAKRRGRPRKDAVTQ